MQVDCSRADLGLGRLVVAGAGSLLLARQPGLGSVGFCSAGPVLLVHSVHRFPPGGVGVRRGPGHLAGCQLCQDTTMLERCVLGRGARAPVAGCLMLLQQQSWMMVLVLVLTLKSTMTLILEQNLDVPCPKEAVVGQAAGHPAEH